MISFSMSEMANLIGGSLYGKDSTFSSVGIDSRTVESGALFVAIKGPNFDGHDFIPSLEGKGVSGVLVSQEVDTSLPSIRVSDTRLSLGDVASAWRDRSGIPLVAITGSNGKTTVKEMVASILAQAGSVLSTIGNLNNDIGVPLTLTRLQEEQYAVVEMGASGPNEIGYLSRMAKPNVAILNNACRSHLEGFGSLEGVAHAKGEIVAGLGEQGIFVINADDNWCDYWKGLIASQQIRTFGVNNSADVSSPKQSYQLIWEGHAFYSTFTVNSNNQQFEIRLPLAGEHNRMNALAAIAATQSLDIEVKHIVEGLASMAPVKGRLNPRRANGGALFIDDSYNANPDSVGAAIDVLSMAPGRKVLVLGRMAELGAEAEQLHREIGRLATERQIDLLLTVGEAEAALDGFSGEGASFENRESLIAYLRQEIKERDVVLVKGSRSAGMEQIVQSFIGGEA